jgi:hypothetical protein
MQAWATPWVLAVIATLSGWVLSWRDIQFIWGVLFADFLGWGAGG